MAARGDGPGAASVVPIYWVVAAGAEVTPEQIAPWLEAIGTKAETGHGTDWVHASCPFAAWRHENGEDANPSFGVMPGPGESRCYCLACDWAGTQTDAVMLLHEHKVEIDFALAIKLITEAEDDAPVSAYPAAYEESVEPRPNEHIYPEYLLDAFEEAYDYCAEMDEYSIHPYLAGRDTPYKVAEFLDLRWDSYRGRILFPVRDGRKRLRGLHGRAAPLPASGPEWEHDKPYKMYPFDGRTNAHVWLGEHWADGEEPLVVAESVFDLARVLEVYPNVISPLTATLSVEKIRRIRGAKYVITMFDEDKAGQRARAKLAYYLEDTEVRNIRLHPGTDAGDLSPNEVDAVLSPLL